jgi:hypothetical protein
MKLVEQFMEFIVFREGQSILRYWSKCPQEKEIKEMQSIQSAASGNK